MNEQRSEDRSIYACNACEWSGPEPDLVHFKHDETFKVCPDCHETVYEVER